MKGKEDMSSVEKDNKNSKKTVLKIGKIIASAIIPIACIIMIYFGFKEPLVNITDTQIQIKGMYGLSINFSDVENITLIEKSMSQIGIGSRTNGFGGFGNTLKGHFNSADLGKHLLFVNSKSSPTIWIERRDKEDVYINYQDSKKTESLFMEISLK